MLNLYYFSILSEDYSIAFVCRYPCEYIQLGLILEDIDITVA